MAIRKTPVTKEKALERLAGLCARSEQCESEIVRKLFNWGISGNDRKEIIDYLKENRYLDDARYARCYARDKARFSKWGPIKIKAELFKRKIQASFIREAIEEVEPSVWKDSLLNVARSKAENLDFSGEEVYENRQKLFRYLISRGFPSSASSKAVSFIIKHSNPD